MNRQTALPHIAGEISRLTGQPASTCESFVRQLFAAVGRALADNESVRVTDLGTFSRSPRADGEGLTVTFTPVSEFAERVNQPFEMFEAVELSPEIDLEELDNLSASPEASESMETGESEEAENLPDTTDLPEVSEIDSYDAADPDSSDNTADPDSSDDAVDSDDSNDPDTGDATDGHIPPVEVTRRYRRIRRKSCRFGWGFLTGFISAIAVIAIACGTFFLIRHYQERAGAPALSEATATADSTSLRKRAEAEKMRDGRTEMMKAPENDSARRDDSLKAQRDIAENEIDTKPSDAPVYDVITTTRYLTTLAKEHYGNMNFWPYIYEENKTILGHPDRIRPGTKVVVPPLSKYGVRADNKNDELTAKRKGVEIYSRYRK